MAPPLPSADDRWPFAIRCAALWLVFATWSSCAGWLLSACGLLNRTGYAIAAIPLVVLCVLLWKATSRETPHFSRPISRLWRRNSTGWWLVALLSLVAGICFAPSNYDALSYRLPRILYWWQENRWHWLEHADHRMNYSGTGFEWQMLPLIIATGSDRFLFLLNWIPFLFLPSLSFFALTAFGVRRRIAARWMWILPLCYGFALQAASIGNDGLGGVLTLAAVAFCGIAIRNQSPLALVLAALAATALSNLKLSNLPLLLPIAYFWCLAAWHLKNDLLRWKIGMVAMPVAAVLVLSSFLPLAYFNQTHSGKWSGDPDDNDKLRITKVIPGLVGNFYNLATATLQPPLLPLSSDTKRKIVAPISGENSLSSYIKSGFPRFKAHVGGEIPIEESAGVGLAITLALVFSLASFLLPKPSRPFPWLPVLATGVAVFAYMSMLGSENTARLMLPYFPLIIAAALAAARAIPSSGFSHLACNWLPFLFLLPALILNPNRALLPMSTLANAPGISQNMRTRLTALHEAYDSRSEPLRPIRLDLPKAAMTIGFAGGPTESAYSLFKPFGNRKIVEAHTENIDSFEWLVAARTGIKERTGQSWDEWLASSPYQVANSYRITFTVLFGAQDWYLLKRKPTASPATQTP